MRKLKDILEDQNRPDDRDLRSRGDMRREQRIAEQRLADLADRLTQASSKTLDELALPENVLDCVLDAKKITSAIARNRQLRLIRRELRTVDAEAIWQRLESRVTPSGSAAAGVKVAEQWTERLVTGGDMALDELAQAFPAADRKRLRQLSRAVASATPERRARARRALTTALRKEMAVRASTDEPDPEPS